MNNFLVIIHLLLVRSFLCYLRDLLLYANLLKLICLTHKKVKGVNYVTRVRINLEFV